MSGTTVTQPASKRANASSGPKQSHAAAKGKRAARHASRKSRRANRG